ncbi:unnamed protein product [Rhizopus stolonifer]
MYHRYQLLQWKEHTRLNCYYCNQNSHIFSRRRQNARHWNCPICGSENARSKTGNVIDPKPLVQKEQLIQSASFLGSSSSNKTNSKERTPKSKHSLCEECLEKQDLKITELQNYIPEETSPDYKKRCKTARAYKEELENRFKLCENCEALLAQIKYKETTSFSSTRLQLLLQDADKHGIPIVISKKSHYKGGAIWCTIHLVPIFLLIYAIYQPPTTSTLSLLTDFFEKITNEWKHLPEDKPFLLYAAPRIESSIRLLIKGAFQLQPTEQNVSILFFLNILFYSHIYWHPLWREVYTKANRLNHWKEYTIVQIILFFSRFVILLYPFLPILLLILYTTALFYFTWNVRIKGKYKVLAS